MKQTLLITLLLVLCLTLFGWICWVRKTGIATQILEKHLGVQVSLGNLDLTRQGATLTDLIIRNPRGYKSSSAFEGQSIEVDTTLAELRANPLTIDRIEMTNLLITIEPSRSGQTNWDKILGNTPKSAGSRHWLIRSLILNNLTVQVVLPNGSLKQYPTLARMEFSNISDATGFPVDAIEKAIFNEVMKNLLRNLDLQKLIQPLIPLPAFPPLF